MLAWIVVIFACIGIAAIFIFKIYWKQQDTKEKPKIKKTRTNNVKETNKFIEKQQDTKEKPKTQQKTFISPEFEDLPELEYEVASEKPRDDETNELETLIEEGEEEDKKDKKEKKELYCAVCKKKFKSDQQWKNHEKSSKHKNKMKELG